MTYINYILYDFVGKITVNGKIVYLLLEDKYINI